MSSNLIPLLFVGKGTNKKWNNIKMIDIYIFFRDYLLTVFRKFIIFATEFGFPKRKTF